MTANHSPTYVRTSKKKQTSGDQSRGAQRTRTATTIPPHTRDGQAERHAQGARRGSGNNRVVKRQDKTGNERIGRKLKPGHPPSRNAEGPCCAARHFRCNGGYAWAATVVVGQNGGVEPVGGLLFCASLFLRIRLRSKEHRRSSTGTTRSSVVAAIAAQQSLLGSCYTILHMFAGGLVSRQDTPGIYYTRVRCCEHRNAAPT